jgi:nucleoside-diphosphate-sugar epimerase
MVFITGGTGFIGAHLLFHLLVEGNEVTALKRTSSNLDYVRKVFDNYSPDGGQLFSRINWVDGDVRDYNFILEITENMDEIYHCAAFVSFHPREKLNIFRTNVAGTANVVNAALEHSTEKFAYVSSVAALDPAGSDEMVDEDHFGNFQQRYTYYAGTKFWSELEVWKGAEEGLKVVVISPSIVLGPCLLYRGSGSFIKFIRKGYGYYPPGMTGFVDVRDVCKILIRLMKDGKANERYIISEGNHSYKEVFDLISDLFKIPKPRKELKPWMTDLAWRFDHIRSMLLLQRQNFTKELHQSIHRKIKYSNEKISKSLNYKFIPFEQTLEDTVMAMDI